MKHRTMVIDLDRCIGCYSCEVACKNENHVNLGVRWNKVYTMGPVGKYPNMEMYFLPTMCQECRDAPCVVVCPTGASHVDANGVKLVDYKKCIACLQCISACPYHARSFDKKAKVVEKCTLCEHLEASHSDPACVKACCAKARIVGDADDPNSKVSKALAHAGKENVHSMPNESNNPTARYILHKKTAKWQEKKTWVFFPEEK